MKRPNGLGGGVQTPLEAPSDAAYFALCRQNPKAGRVAEGKKKEGARYRTTSMERLYGDPDASTGELAECWPVAAFNLRDILQRFGPGKYLVIWLDASRRKRIGSRSFLLDDPGKRKVGKGGLRAADDDAPAAAPVAQNEFSPMTVFQMLREERATAQNEAAAIAQSRIEADRAFHQTHTQMLLDVLKETRPRHAAPASSELDMGLLRREMQLTIREQMAAIREDIRQNHDDGGGDDPPVPETFSEAFNLAGVELINALSQDAPELVRKFLPKLFTDLRREGYVPGPEVRRHLERAGKTNGAPAPTNGAAAAQARQAAADLLGGAGDDENDE